MANQADVLTAFRQHLVDQGLVRKPSDGTDPALAPMFVEPVEGAIAAGEGPSDLENDDTLILSIFWGGDVPAGTDDGWRLRGTVDVRFRSKSSAGLQRAEALALAIRQEFYEPGGFSKRAWQMGGVFVLESQDWAGLQRIGADAAQGYDHVAKVYLEVYA